MACDPHFLQVLRDFFRHAFGQINQRMVLTNINAADETRFEAGLIGDGANQVARTHAMAMTDFDAVGHHAGFGFSTFARCAWFTRFTTFARFAFGAFRTLASRLVVIELA